MGYPARGWIISDSIKLVVVFVLVIVSLLQLEQPSSQDKRKLHVANSAVGIVMLVWISDLNGLLGMGWQSYLFLSDFIVGTMAEEALYIGYTITVASYLASNQTSELPDYIGQAFIAVGITYAICNLCGTILTAQTNNYKWSVIRHSATTFLLLFTSLTTSILIFKLKRLLSRYTLTISPSVYEEGGLLGEEDVADNYVSKDLRSKHPPASDRKQRGGQGEGARSKPTGSLSEIQKNLTRILLCMGPVCGLGLASLVILLVRIEDDHRSYSNLTRDFDDTYSLEIDIVGYWSVIGLHFFFIYYAFVPLAKLCGFHLRTRHSRVAESGESIVHVVYDCDEDAYGNKVDDHDNDSVFEDIYKDTDEGTPSTAFFVKNRNGHQQSAGGFLTSSSSSSLYGLVGHAVEG